MRPPLRPCPPHAQQEEAAEVSRALGSRPTALPGKRATCTIVATSTPALCQCGTHFPCLLHARTGPKKATPAPSDPVTPAGPVMVAVTPEPPWESLQRVSPAGPNLELPMATTPRRGHQGGSRAERRETPGPGPAHLDPAAPARPSLLLHQRAQVTGTSPCPQPGPFCLGSAQGSLRPSAALQETD